jgi:hypothetical protein
MNNSEHLFHVVWWSLWWICSFAMAIVISNRVVMMFVEGLSPDLVSIWLAGHIWMFAAMWIFLMVVHFLGIRWHIGKGEK